MDTNTPNSVGANLSHDPDSEPITPRQRGFLKVNNLWNDHECYTKAKAIRIIREFVAQQLFSEG